MPVFINLEKTQLIPTHEDFLETARYLGYKKLDEPEQKIQNLIQECCLELLNDLAPQAVYESFQLTLSPLLQTSCENQAVNINFGDLSFNSVDLGRNLKECTTVYLMAATIGPKVDMTIRKTQRIDTVKAAIFQAAGAMYVEKLVDYVNTKIKAQALAEGLVTKPRYSPGYGDVPLAMQKDFFRLLPCTRIGLTLMDTLIMAPEKSVTAFIGCKPQV